jgi:hypothetical protein
MSPELHEIINKIDRESGGGGGGGAKDPNDPYAKYGLDPPP